MEGEGAEPMRRNRDAGTTMEPSTDEHVVPALGSSKPVAVPTPPSGPIGGGEVAEIMQAQGRPYPWRVPFGPFRLQHEKTHSRMLRSETGEVLLKEYLVIASEARQEREALAIAGAERLGVNVPKILGAGTTESTAWTLFQLLPGSPGSLRPGQSLINFVNQVVDLGTELHSRALDAAPGTGWFVSEKEEWTQREFLMSQFSPSASSRPWWSDLDRTLEATDLGPVVYLHGDLKAEHFIVDHHRVAVVDWEACARGPACHDRADALFHALRDLLYLGWGLHQLPHDLLQRLQVPGPVMAHRVLLWLDRRPPHGMEAASRRNLDRLMLAEPAEVSRCAADLLSAAISY